MVSQKTFLFLFLFLFSLTTTYGQGTSFVDVNSKVNRFAEPQWFKDNIPFVEVPDKQIEDVYYYRWSSLKRHLRYAYPGAGYIITEFVHAVGYSLKFDTINAAAGHHIDEARWLRDSRYVKDYINLWSREGAGTNIYSEWIAYSAYQAFLVNGDAAFIKSQQEGFVRNFNGWDGNFEPSLNLYFITPIYDAMEYSASSVQTDDPFGGGNGYRPSFNSELYGNAMAIAKIARMNNDTEVALEFETRGEAIRQSIINQLWDEDRKFFYHMFRDNNPNNALLDAREEIGFFPWRWGVMDKEDPVIYGAIWEQLFDNQGFGSDFGPTTCEQRSQWFDGNQTNQCCWWNGNSWPYSTGIVIKSLAAQIKIFAETAFANLESFYELFQKYTKTHYKNGIPYVAECHSALYDFWVCDSFNHSEHYAHSTYTDNVLSDLIGIEPQADNVFQVNPLVPTSWTYFIAENVPYHGHNITVLYDADGTRYKTGNSGLQIYVNGNLATVQPEIGLLKVDIPPPVADGYYNGDKKIENYAANYKDNGYPMVDASYTTTDTSPWQAVDGRIFYDRIPSNRWSNYGSPNAVDWVSVDFGPGRSKNISQVKLYIYADANDGGGVDCPSSIMVEYLNGSTWTAAQNQLSTPEVCVPNDVLLINFDSIRSQKVRVFFTNPSATLFVGISELEIWAPWPQSGGEGSYEAEDGVLNLANIDLSETASGGSYVGQIDAPDASVEFTGVWVDEDETYDIQVYYANAEDNVAVMTVTTNNVHSQIVSFPNNSNAWGEFGPNGFVSIRLPLLRGNNVIVFKHGEHFAELDKITVVPFNTIPIPTRI